MKRYLITALAAIVLFSALPLTASADFLPPKPHIDFNQDADILDDSKIEDFGNIILGKDSNILEIPIRWEGFNGATGPQDIDADVINDLRFMFSDGETQQLFPIIHKLAWKQDQDAKYVLSGQDIGTASGYIWVESDYKNKSTGTTWSSARYPINGNFIDPTINKEIIAITDRPITVNGPLLNLAPFDADKLNNMGRVYSGSDLAFKLDSDHFKWYPDITDMRVQVRKSTLDNNKVRTYTMFREGKNVIESIGIENIDGAAYIVIRFKEDFPFVDERDFAFDLYMTLRGERKEETMIEISGSVENDIIYIKGDNERADLGQGGVMVEADGACRNAELYLGAGLSVYQNLIGGERYYARATDNRDTGDVEIMNYFPDIKKVISITSKKNISNNATVRIINSERDEYGDEILEKFKTVYQVYDADGKLIGTTEDELPLRDKYFLAIQELLFDEFTFDEIQQSLDGTGEEWRQNGNMNPNTGRGIGEEE